MPTPDEKTTFLEKDLPDALKWLFVGAVVWQAAKEKPERCCHQQALGMFMSFVQARALYEFYYGDKKKPDDARAGEFCASWREPQRPYYLKYMSGEAPANKRAFHLVYGRSGHSGGREDGDESEDLKNQVLNFAKELRQITETFAKRVKPEFVGLVQSAVNHGLEEAQKAAVCFGIANPL